MEPLTILNFVALLAVLALLVRREFKTRKTSRQNFEEALKTASGIMLEAVGFLDQEKEAVKYLPIRHAKIDGPRLAKLTSAVSYWVVKTAPDSEPFPAVWYEQDTTCPKMGDDKHPMPVGSLPDVIPADTYVDLMGRRIPGAKFRTLYELAPTIIEVAKFKPKAPLRSTSIVTSNRRSRYSPSSEMTPDEEAKLAEEFEVVENPPSLRK